MNISNSIVQLYNYLLFPIPILQNDLYHHSPSLEYRIATRKVELLIPSLNHNFCELYWKGYLAENIVPLSLCIFAQYSFSQRSAPSALLPPKILLTRYTSAKELRSGCRRRVLMLFLATLSQFIEYGTCFTILCIIPLKSLISY